MVRKDTNKQYSLRKLKKGTASVAVALTVVGAGFANQTEVKAEVNATLMQAKIEAIRQMQREGRDLAPLLASTIQNNDDLKETLDKTKKEIDDLKSENEGLGTTLQKKEQELKGLKDDELERLKNERHDHDKKEAERKALEDKLADKQEHLDGALRYINEKEAERKEKEAEQKKLKEEKQISDASRQGLRRDLDASREAKKQVEKALEEANSKLAALEKLNKELEESKKLTEKEKAELQAKLEAEAKALKEKLAKQAEELAKLRAEKASDSQTPDAKPGNKAVPGKGQAPQAGTKPNQNKAPMKETKRQLPSTGEAANPFFTAAALTVMATAGVAAVVKRKEEN
ncbi:YSIRK-type signal peptide-containing protein [Streptococcus pyogenes]|uniref:YSIRK-type signal peptide-containing protein n=1 Tax=Streptococcus pyogenes TaxID=1314 RepID=UPI0010A12249|nr:YSIRK-type signal peptide-containing protein [Streptococcus pyogenes]VHH05837.1 M18 protein [Streptococcus pyogenes]